MKTALVTGASSGIGYATAKSLSDAGYRLIICGRRQERLFQLQNELTGRDVHTLSYDVRNRVAVEQAISSLPGEWRNVDVLINNAGNAFGLATVESGDVHDWDLMIDTNVKGLLYVTRAVLPLMPRHSGAHIVNISSIAGKQTYVNGVVYCASKAAVERISEGLRLELINDGIKVTNIAPGAVETEFSQIRFHGDMARAKQVYNGFESLKAKDIADAILYTLQAPSNVTIADITILAGAQAAATVVAKKV